MRKLMFLLLLISFRLTAQSTAEPTNPTAGDAAAQTQETSPRSKSSDPIIKESGDFFPVTLTDFSRSMRAYGYPIYSIQANTDNGDGTKTARLIYLSKLDYEWIVGGQTNRIREVKVMGHDIDMSSRAEIRGWMKACIATLTSFFPQLPLQERYGLIERALSDGSYTYENATITFSNETAGSLNLSVKVNGSTSEQAS